MLIKSRFLRNSLIALAIALVLTIGSFGVRRHGPQMGEFGTTCGPAGDQTCYEPLLNGGWPLGYVVDMPGIHAEESLGLEDELRLERFGADILFYFGLLMLAWRYGDIRRRMRTELREARAAREAKEAAARE